MAKFKENAKRPFGMRDKIGYAAGDFANDLTFVIAAMFMMKFYTDIMGVSSAVVGLVMMVAKVVDAFTDVAMGQIVDRSRYTAKGKFAPWIMRFAGPVAVASFLIFAPYFADKPMGFKIGWMFFTYILWGSVCYTGVNIPYGSMASAISDDATERQELSTWRNIGATVAQIVIASVLPLIVYMKDAEGHQVLDGNKLMLAAGVCSVLAVLVYFICYSLSTERVVIQNDENNKKNVAEMLKIVFTSRAFLGIIVSALILLLVQLTLSGMGNYVYPNYFNNTTFLSIGALVNCLVVLVLAAFIGKLVEKFGKKEMASVGAIIGAVTLFIMFVIHTHNPLVYFVLGAIGNIGLGIFNLVCWAMIIDVIDDIEVHQNYRSDGTVYAVYSFARKLGQAGASGLTGLLLSIAGYTVETAFDTGVVNKIYNLATAVPAVGMVLLALSLIFFYPLSKKKVAENIETLRQRRAK
ncbi:MAG: glycoside-pentoside-hexuronide (GPH):cation symporter [Lachnospiraceae bacterium]|nr:glycoside-pentoside-hexuronide (GPH):cation symporter [Lachnospiraceae bacterium]